MTWGVVSYPVELAGPTLFWTPTGSPQESAALGALAGQGWAVSGTPSGATGPAAMGSLVRALESAIFSAMDVEGDVNVTEGRYVLPPRILGWQVFVESTVPLDQLSLTFPSTAVARQWGCTAATIAAVEVSSTQWLLFSDGDRNMTGAWSGGCERVAQDEPDTRHRVSVSASPYTTGGNTHVRLGARDYRTVRWVYVDAANIHALQAGEEQFAEVAGRLADDENGLFDKLVERFAAGDELVLTVQNRAGVAVQVVDADPSVSAYANRVGQSGRRYDVEVEFEVVE